MTPTPQKSPREIAKDILLKLIQPENEPDKNGIQIIEEVITNERTAYNALLEKVKLIETERDELKTANGILQSACELHKNANGMLIESCEVLQKRVDSEYDRGIMDAHERSENTFTRDCPLEMRDAISEAILKLRRV